MIPRRAANIVRRPTPNPVLAMTVALQGRDLPSPIRIELRKDVVPHTVERIVSTVSSRHYDGTLFHRVDFDGGIIVGGMTTTDAYFPDENFRLLHNAPYVVSLPNSGPNTNTTQFMILRAPCKGLDGCHVVVGSVVSGHETVDAVARVATVAGRPRVPVVITRCTIEGCASAAPTSASAPAKRGREEEVEVGKRRKLIDGTAVAVTGLQGPTPGLPAHFESADELATMVKIKQNARKKHDRKIKQHVSNVRKRSMRKKRSGKTR